MKLYCSSTANPCWIKIKVLFIKLAAVLATDLSHNITASRTTSSCVS